MGPWESDERGAECRLENSAALVVVIPWRIPAALHFQHQQSRSRLRPPNPSQLDCTFKFPSPHLCRYVRALSSIRENPTQGHEEWGASYLVITAGILLCSHHASM